MDIVKNTVLSLLRCESTEKRNAKRPSIKCESAQSNKSESEGDWVFTARDYGWSEAPTYTLKNPIELASVNVEELPFVDVMTPDVLDDVVGEKGEFVLYKADEAQYGFQASFGEDLDTMIYAYCSADELKDKLHQLQQYIKGIPADIDADVDKFLELANNEANEEDMDMSDMGSADVAAPDAAAEGGDDFSMDDVSIDVQDTSEAIDYAEELDDLVDGDCMRLLDYLADHLSRDGMKYFYEFVRDKVKENQEELNATNEQ